MEKRRAYAEDTTVPAEKSEAEIKGLLRTRGATNVVTFEIEAKSLAIVQFDFSGKRMRLTMPLPRKDDPKFTKDPRYSWKKRTPAQIATAWEQVHRAKWRALWLTLKTKFVTADAGAETLEMALLAYVVLPDGKTVAEHAIPAVEQAYLTGKLPPLLGPGTGSEPE